MNLSKFYKHFNISPNQLKKILKEHDIKDDIRFVKVIPQDWINIVSKTTGVEVFKDSTNSEPTNSEPTDIEPINRTFRTPEEDLSFKLKSCKK